MSGFNFSGAGDPTEFDGFDDPLFISLGAGAPTTFEGFELEDVPLALGAGDPTSLSDVTFTLTFGYGGVWAPQSGQWSPLRTPDPTWLSEEGGTLINLFSNGVDLDNVPFRVDFIDALGQPHPILEPGCYAARQGFGSDVYPEPDERTLVCGSPPLPIGVYDIRVTTPTGGIAVIPDAARVVHQPGCIELDTMRDNGLSADVYPGAWPDQRR